MLPTKFQVNWSFGSEDEAKNIFMMTAIWLLEFEIETILAILIYKSSRRFIPSFEWIRISDRTILAFFFYLQVIRMLHTKFRINWGFGSGEKARIDF